MRLHVCPGSLEAVGETKTATGAGAESEGEDEEKTEGPELPAVHSLESLLGSEPPEIVVEEQNPPEVCWRGLRCAVRALLLGLSTVCGDLL